MKKLIILFTLICFAVSAPAMAELKGLMCVGPYAGYTLGFGDAFKDFEGFGTKISSDAGINFGGQFHYGITPKLMFGGEVFVQSYSTKIENDFEFEFKRNPNFSGFAKAFDLSEAQQTVSDSEMKINFLGSFLFALSYMEKAMLMANFGAGLYDTGNNEIGFFGGIVYQRMVATTMALYLMPRLHIVLADNSFMLLQLAVGLNFWLGSTGAPISN